jgi:hypothetical protein
MVGRIILGLLTCNIGGFVVHNGQIHHQVVKNEKTASSDVIKCIQKAYDPVYIRDIGVQKEIDFPIEYKNLILSNNIKTLVPSQFVKTLEQTQAPTSSV